MHVASLLISKPFTMKLHVLFEPPPPLTSIIFKELFISAYYAFSPPSQISSKFAFSRSGRALIAPSIGTLRHEPRRCHLLTSRHARSAGIGLDARRPLPCRRRCVDALEASTTRAERPAPDAYAFYTPSRLA